MAYTKINWEDLPRTDTPINATNLNIMDEGIYDATYENGLNVSNEVDEDYRVNFLKGKNLFDASNVLYGKYVDNTTGQILSSNARISCNYIQVEPETDYIFSNITDLSTNGKGMAYYNSNKEFISGTLLSSLTNGKFTTPANCKYIIFSYDVASTQFNSIMLNEGNVALPYEPYTRSIYVDNEEIYTQRNWKYLGSTTNNTTISLPSDFDEVFALVKTNNSDFRKLTFNIPNIVLTSSTQYFNTAFIGASTSTYNGARIAISTTSANLDSAYNDGNDVRDNTTTYWYYK